MLSDELTRHTGNYYGKYRGIVRDNTDDGRRGRLRVIVPDIFGPEALVTAEPCFPHGHFFVPPKDANVWVEFAAGDTRAPIWVGVWYPAGAVPPEAAVTPPDHQVIRSTAGHVVDLTDTGGGERILIRHSGGASVSIESDGSVHVSADHIVLDGSKVEVGSGASEPTLLGNGFSQLWTQLLTHVHGPPGSPSPQLAPLALQPGVHLSQSAVVK
ncbi:phage baseplate assembly protein V [Streptomyces sp. NPDC054766]|uniref:phage baseplate assembly protein V n=1 Tax=Streptomyces rhizosphaerihabitans TaxID=1266770 RepID=UPI0021C1E068|nr:phage baseplate assembly protein V [Streptomyces rhizosphaerihabitans]MCT9003879.1 phage baseplate assembly protein V [Streptomyces rhizosphaerihabitans]